MCCEPPQESPAEDCECFKLRVDYVLRQYGFYTTHMNQVFNFYILAAALIAAAYVQSISADAQIELVGSQSIAVVGALLSTFFLGLHLRGFQIADILDDELKQLEPRLRVSFMRRRKESQFGPFKNTILFSLIYLVFIVGFLLAAFLAADWRA